MAYQPKTFRYPVLKVLQENEIYAPQEEIITTPDGEHNRLTSINVIDKIHPSWRPLLLERGLRINERMKQAFMTAYTNGFTVRPNAEDVFNVFSTPISSVRAVIVGQDPYPGWDQETKKPKACGYAFATLSKETPPSLQRIRVAVTNVLGPITIIDKENPNALRGWINQGVLLLNNTPLLFLQGGSEDQNSETSPRIRSLLAFPSNIWRGITASICKEITTVNPNCPFILMGREAEYLSRIVSKSTVTHHPSTRSDCDFDGKCFTNIPMIVWTKM